MIRTLCLIFLSTFFCTAYAQEKTRTYIFDKNAEPRERFVDFTNLRLDIAFEPTEKLVIGKVKHDFTVLRESIDTLFLDGIKMKYDSVYLNGTATEYNSSDKGITLKFNPSLKRGEQHQISINYHANPAKGLYFIGWNDETKRSRKQIWTQGQGIDNRHWIPMYDERNDKVVSEIEVYFEKGYEVLSNGNLISKNEDLSDGNLWHYKIAHPHSPYLIMLGIGEYDIKKERSELGTPLQFYYYKNQPEQFEPTYRFSKEMFNLFEKEIGINYPWETYSQIPVQDFMYGAMENTTATIFGDFYLVDSSGYLDRNYVRVNAHELAHQWFGNMITARSSDDHWLQESFATHFDMMYQKEAFGQDYYDWVRRGYSNQAIEASKKDLKPLAHSEAGSVRHYPKGAFVLQILKYVIGKEDFNLGVKAYLKRHAYENVDSDDLLSAFHDELGYSLNWFWEDWVYQGGEPNYKVEFNERKGQGTFEVIQVDADTNLTGNFKMPINFELYFKDGSKEKQRVWVENDTTIVSFSLKDKKYDVDFVLFDPNGEIMKTVEFEKSAKMLKAQAEKAPNMLDRYDAIAGLEDLKLKKKEEFLIERFKKENFQAIKTEILKQFSKSDSKLRNGLFEMALKDNDVEVRRAALQYVGKLNTETEALAVKLLEDESYEVIALALEVFVINDFENGQKYLKLTENKIGNRSKNIRITWLKIAALLTKDEKHLNELVDYTSSSFEFLTRLNAFSALRDINYLNPEVLDNLIEARFHFNSTLRRSASSTLSYFYEKEGFKNEIKEYLKSIELSEKQKRGLKKFLED